MLNILGEVDKPPPKLAPPGRLAKSPAGVVEVNNPLPGVFELNNPVPAGVVVYPNSPVPVFPKILFAGAGTGVGTFAGEGAFSVSVVCCFSGASS